MPHSGDPTPRSATDVLSDAGYKKVVAEQVPQVGGQFITALIVLHCGTETHWMVTYLATKQNEAMTWQQVIPVVETRTIYRPVP